MEAEEEESRLLVAWPVEHADTVGWKKTETLLSRIIFERNGEMESRESAVKQSECVG